MNTLLGRAPPSFHLWVTEVTVMNTSNGNFEGYHLFIKHMEGEIHEKENSCSPCNFMCLVNVALKQESPLILLLCLKLYGVP